MTGKSSLLAHVDTDRVTKTEVLAAPEPEFTPTWRPYSHKTVLNCIQRACDDLNLKVGREEYSLSKDDNRSKMFGVWEIEDMVTSEIRFAMGIRNSTNKAMSVGICAGERVFVCDNLVFSGSFVIFRKHTGQLVEEEIAIIAHEAVKTTLGRFENLVKWHEDLRQVELSDQQASFLTIAAMRRGVIPSGWFQKFNDLYFESDSKYTPTLHGWHGAATELITKLCLETVFLRNDIVNKFIRHEVPILLKGNGEGGKRVFSMIEEKADAAHKGAVQEQKSEARKASSEIRETAQKTLKEKNKQRAKKAEAKSPRKAKKDALPPAQAQKKPLKAHVRKNQRGMIDFPCGLKVMVKDPEPKDA